MLKKIQTLTSMYDDMYSKIDLFSKKGFDDVMNQFFDTYGSFVRSLGDEAKVMSPEEQKALYTELALALSVHVKELIGEPGTKKMEKVSIPHNMTMAAYLLPLLTYYRIPECDAFAARLVEVWNEQHTTSLTLSLSSYDGIAGGFKKSIFCYITTAVCENMKKPDDCYELQTLRDYRDHYLMSTPEGAALVEEYYALAPRIVLAIDMLDDSSAVYDDLYRGSIRPCIDDIEHGEYLSCKSRYVTMVRALQKEYLLS